MNKPDPDVSIWGFCDYWIILNSELSLLITWPAEFRPKEKSRVSRSTLFYPKMGLPCPAVHPSKGLTPLTAHTSATQVGVADLTAWSTFIFRATGLRAVEDFIVEVLQTLVGHTRVPISQGSGFASHPSFTYILYHAH